jgi:hypothetical protein
MALDKRRIEWYIVGERISIWARSRFGTIHISSRL